MRWTAARKLEVLLSIERRGLSEMKQYLEYHNISPDELHDWRYHDVGVYQAANSLGVELEGLTA